MKIFIRYFICISLFFTSIILTGCHHPAVPKPYGYFRIDMPAHTYQAFSLQGYPYSFLISEAARIKMIDYEGEKYWIDIDYPDYNASIHCSYKPVNGNLAALTDDAVEFVFSHAIKASAIPEQAYEHPEEKVYGLWFDLEGNTATPLQFFLTDSVHHFFRAALYFNNIPNQDSVAPVAGFIREDMQHLIETFKWQK
jgi:gliding motility-associated lipoprotein GldD